MTTIMRWLAFGVHLGCSAQCRCLVKNVTGHSIRWQARPPRGRHTHSMPAVVSPQLVGRGPEIARLSRLLEGAIGGQGRVVFVAGEAGIGKSRLVAELADLARTQDVRVLSGRAGQTGAATAFHPFVEAFQSGLEPAELSHATLEPYRALLERLLGLEAVDAAAADTPALAAMEAILRLLRLSSGPRGLLLVIEDVHSADQETLGTIEYISDRLEAERILCVATDRSDLDGISGNLITSLVGRRVADRVELHPLTREEVETLARVALGSESIPSPLLDALQRRATGNPFLIEEMLGAYIDAGGSGRQSADLLLSSQVADRIPLSYREVVRERLDGLDERARAVTFAAAVVGRNFDPRLLAPITGLAEDDVTAGLKNSIRGNVLTTSGDHFAGAYGFRHALGRESVLAELLPEERAVFSDRAARAIEDLYPDLPGEWCERAANLYEEGGLPIDAARLLQESARRALTRSALQTAEAALLHARDLVPSDWMMWMAIDDLLLDVYARSGRTEGLLQRGSALIAVYLQRYGTVFSRRHVAEIHLKIARCVLASADWKSAEEHLIAATKTIEQDQDASLASEISALSARAALAAGRTTEARLHATDAVAATAERSASRRCDALDSLATASLQAGELEEGREAWLRVIALADGPKLAIWKVRGLLGLGEIDVLETGDASRLTSARALALEIGAIALGAAIELQAAWAHLGRPDVVSARTHLERCWELIGLHGLGIRNEATAAQSMRLALDREREQLQTLKQNEGSEPSLQASLLANGDAVLAVVEGDDRAALKHLQVAVGLFSGNPKGWWAGLGRLLTVAFNEEGPPTHDPWLSEGPRLPMDHAYAAYARAIRAGRQGDGALADAAVAEGDRVMPPGWRRHHARRVVADAALDAGWGDPGTWAGEAIEFFDRVSMPGLTTTCRATLRRAGVPVRRRGRGESAVPEELQTLGVTSREMDVLNLVANRLANREIAEQLFLSPRTVETHVSNLQRKTRTANRRELIEFARRQPAPQETDP
jgi:DNA-binding CsgD family transcriptional regulator/tetratricopeptide (TPR) repeat protein